MTVTDQIKILDRKIMQNEAQYDLDRKAAKILALSSNNLDKYEYLTGEGEDLGLKPSTIEQAKFEYSLLGKSFNKGLDKDDKEEGLFKRLKNIESKNEDQGKKQLEAIKNNNMGSKPLKTIIFFGTISEEAKKLMVNIKWTSSFTLKIYGHDLMLQEADNQVNLEKLINNLNNNYNPKNLEI